jgi:hypothetical protein
MLDKALQVLPGEPGFVLMVESANIDKMSHSNTEEFVGEVKELDVAVQLAMQWKLDHPLDNTLIILTADHETGALSVPNQTVTAGTIPTMSWGSMGHSAANVPFFATWPSTIQGLVLDNTETFNIMEDAINFSSGGKPPVITQLTVSGITESSATITWSTTEPSDSKVVIGGETIFGNTRTTAHSVLCDGLTPDTLYGVEAQSTDLGGFTGTQPISFRTKPLDFDAHVISEPIVSLGLKTGTYLGTLTAGDGLTQVFQEANDGVGAGIEVEYVLHTSATPSLIDSLTIEAALSWSGGTTEGFLAEILVAAPDSGTYWQTISAFPFIASTPLYYVNGNGDIRIRFTDTISVRREVKDKLTVDYLAGKVVTTEATPAAPVAPSNLSASALSLPVTLSWTDNSNNEMGFLIWRYTSAGGWIILGSALPNPTGGFTDYTDHTATANASYIYVVRAYNSDGYADSDPLPVLTPASLVAPTTLKAVASKTGITLTWVDTNTIETGYQILRATVSTVPLENASQVGMVGPNVQTFKDTAERGVTYYYWVRAIKGQGTAIEYGPISNTAFAKIK